MHDTLSMNSTKWLIEPRRWELTTRQSDKTPQSTTEVKKMKYQANQQAVVSEDARLQRIREKLHRGREAWKTQRETHSLKLMDTNSKKTKKTCEATTKNGKKCSFAVVCGNYCRKHS